MQIDPYAKVAMISALGQETIVKEAILIGAKSFIVKPFKGDQIIAALQKML
jgi:two-component system chemotaxis response regulator CheY